MVLETDEYFYTQVGDDPTKYGYRADLMPKARHGNLARFREAVSRRITPIVIDRGNGLNEETQAYARYAVEHEYHVELKEPESPWWQEIRVLLKYKDVTREILDRWAEQLAERSKSTHRVPAATIRSWMEHWKHDLTVEEILNYRTGFANR